MKIEKDYRRIAQELYRANFRLYGVGHFDLSVIDVERLLKIINQKEPGRLAQLNSLYEELEKSRMG